MQKIKELFGRKLTLAVILTAISTVFVIFGMADFDGWSEFQTWIYGSFVFGNGVEHASKNLNTTEK